MFGDTPSVKDQAVAPSGQLSDLVASYACPGWATLTGPAQIVEGLTGKLIKLVQELYLAQFASVSFQTLQARPCNSSHTALREPTTMISLEDCIAICGLDADQVAAIAEHEHISEMAAAALANYVLKQAGGPERLRAIVTHCIDGPHYIRYRA
jgi:hypothetical protein